MLGDQGECCFVHVSFLFLYWYPHSAWIDAPDDLNFSADSYLPSHFAHLRFPDPSAYTISPPSHPNTLRLKPSALNLTGLDSASATTPQTFVGRRQVNSEFIFSVELEYDPVDIEEEAGVTVFLVQVGTLDFLLLISSWCARIEPPYRSWGGFSLERIRGCITIPSSSDNDKHG